MIEKIKLSNFQSHEQTELDLCPGTNMIVGRSDSGKTAILRALSWVQTNRPTTTSVIRQGSGSKGARGADRLGTAEVSMTVRRADGVTGTVRRVRGHETNQYFVNDKAFSAVGKDIPEEVLNLLNLDKINVQKQLDLPYLLLDSSGEVAATFNKFTNLDAVDRLTTMLNAELRDSLVAKRGAADQSVSLTEQIKKLAYIDELGELVTALELVEAELSAKTAKQQLLCELADGRVDILDKYKRHSTRVLDLDFDRKELERWSRELQKNETRRNEVDMKLMGLQSLDQDIRGAVAELEELAAYIPLRLPQIERLKTAEALIRAIEEIDIEVKSKLDAKLQLHRVSSQIEDCRKQMSQSRSRNYDLCTKLSLAQSELASVDTCVMCGQVLTSSAKELMLLNVRKSV